MTNNHVWNQFKPMFHLREGEALKETKKCGNFPQWGGLFHSFFLEGEGKKVWKISTLFMFF